MEYMPNIAILGTYFLGIPANLESALNSLNTILVNSNLLTHKCVS